MSNAPLPSQLDVRKLAQKGVEISAETPVSQLPRIVDMLANESGSVAVDLRFYTDEERIRRLDGSIRADVEVCCQRCLEPMPLHLQTEFALGIVWSEEDAKRLPAGLDPLIVGEELVDLADVVSEEFILSMPFVSYHAPEACRQVANYSVGAIAEVSESDSVAATEKGDNPFKVLEQLKLGK